MNEVTLSSRKTDERFEEIYTKDQERLATARAAAEGKGSDVSDIQMPRPADEAGGFGEDSARS